MRKFTSLLLALIFYTSAFGQQNIKKLNVDELKLPTETASRALYIDGSNQIKSSTTTSTELGYVAGADSNIQDQLDAKVSDTAYDATSWNGVLAIAPSKNAVRDQIESILTSISGIVSDVAYDATSWNGVTSAAPSKNSVRDQIETMLTAISATVSDTAYNATSWDSVTTIAPSKNAVRDEIESVKSTATTNDGLAVHKAGTETITGDKLITGQFTATSTTKGNRPCPVMTEAQRNSIGSPALGDCITNSTTLSLNIYDGSGWKSAGGGLSNWVTAFSYAIGDIVVQSLKIYQCATAHTSGTFATDLAALKWTQLSNSAADMTGVLPMANGGLAKATTPVLGSLVTTDADSAELLSGTTGQIPQFNTGSAMTAVNKSILGKAQNVTAVTMEEMQVPNNQLTETASGKYLNETGNKNILANPSFENTTADTSWTNNGSEVGVSETTTIIDGLKSLKFSPSAETINLVQSSTLYQANFAGVQGLASVRINTTIALTVCAVQAATVSTTDCVTTNTDAKWNLYKIPFILGTTSNGISIVAASSTGTVYVDDAFVGAVDVVKTEDQSRIAGESYFAGTTSCDWLKTAGAIGAITASSPCPGPTIVRSYMGTWATTDSDLPRQTITNLPAGTYKATFYAHSYLTTANNAAFAINDGTTTCEAVGANSITSNYSGSMVSCTFTYATSGTRVFELYAGSNTGTVVINNQSTSPRISTKFILEYFGSSQVYSSQCGANCVELFSANVSSAGVVTNDNNDWITGNATLTDTSLYTFAIPSGIFTVAPICWTGVGQSGTDSSSAQASMSSFPTTTAAVVRGWEPSGSGSGTRLAQAFTLYCRKNGVDLNSTRIIQGTFKDAEVATGFGKPKSCYYAFGGAAATLTSPVECTTGTCIEVFDSCGTGSPPAFNATALYTGLTWAAGTWANSSFIHCTCTAFDITTNTIRECDPIFTTSNQSWATSSSGGMILGFYTMNEAGTQLTSYNTVKCTGSAP